MANITIENAVVKIKGEDTSPERGYDLVIQEDLKYKVIWEGSKFKKSGWSLFNKKNIEVFAVSNETDHSNTFEKVITHVDGVNSFYLKITFYFSVLELQENKITLVKRLSNDPLKKLKNRISSVLSDYLRNTDWETLSNPSLAKVIQQKALDELIQIKQNEAVPMFDHLKEYAEEYGIALNGIGFDITLHEKILEVRVKKKEIDASIEIEQKEQEFRVRKKYNDNDLRELERKEKLKDKGYNTIENYIDIVGQSIANNSRSLEDLEKDVFGVLGMQQKISQGGGSPALGGNPNNQMLLSGGTGDTNLTSEIYDIILTIKKADLPPDDQRLILSALFHLTGELLNPTGKEALQGYLDSFLELSHLEDLIEYIRSKGKALKKHIKKENLL